MTNRTSELDRLVADERREAELWRYDVLGHAPGRELQALVEIAAQISAVPTAAINIVTSTTQQQLATTGFTPAICAREDAMCAAVLDQPERVVVPDAREDERFRDNPFVSGALSRVRFYASSPLTTPTGVIIGRLCVFDFKPRHLDEAQQDALVAIAERVVDVLELRLRSRELEDSLAQLTETRDELRRSNEALSVFAGQISHDLRTPLTAIMASTEMLGQQPSVVQDEWAERLVATAFRSATRMAGMIEQILAHARVGAQLRTVPTDVGAVVASVLEDLEPTLLARNAQVTVGALPIVDSDDQQLYSVLLNLLSNAVKYARPGVPPVIEVSAERRDTSWRISVQDNGIGIPTAEHDRVFGLFKRVETSVDGSGIGLATVKRIVEAHGGRIGISPVDGPGTTVWFEMPHAPTPRP
ncbi:ATP-binding protein [Terrabacter sp. GCM10028922]|uniref:sensor histidine kinase n=1 Tax=Terrabacter sp. GCM10028922 TaxID=3273428 RepID=UPI00360F54D2